MRDMMLTYIKITVGSGDSPGAGQWVEARSAAGQALIRTLPLSCLPAALSPKEICRQVSEVHLAHLDARWKPGFLKMSPVAHLIS